MKILVLLLLLSHLIFGAPDSFRLCSFNLKNFGHSKINELPSVYELTQGCDIAVFQELQTEVDVGWSTPPLGRNHERYLFISDLPECGFDMYNGTEFDRPPAMACYVFENKNLVVLDVHVRPRDAKNEIAALPLAYAQAKNRFNTSFIVIAGDLNADCRYFKRTDDLGFNWVIEDDEDTTLGKTDCAYDRILIKNNILELNHGIVDAGNLSDHKMIWAELMLIPSALSKDWAA